MGTKNKATLEHTLSILKNYQGETPVVIYIADTKERLFVPGEYFVSVNDRLMEDLLAFFGEENVKLN